MTLVRISAQPLCFEMIEGTPICIASRGEMPKGSDTEGITYTSDERSIS